MTFIDSPVGPASNPVLAPFFGAAASPSGTHAPEVIAFGDEATLDGSVDYGELFASLINAPQNNGLFFTPKSGVQAVNRAAAEQADAHKAVLETNATATAPEQVGAIDLTAFGIANSKQPEPLFGIQLSNGGIYINEPGSSAFQKMQTPADTSSASPSASNASTEPGAIALQDIAKSVSPDLALSGLPADQLGIDSARGDATHMLPVKALASFMGGLPAEIGIASKVTLDAATVPPTSPVAGAQATATVPDTVSLNGSVPTPQQPHSVSTPDAAQSANTSAPADPAITPTQQLNEPDNFVRSSEKTTVPIAQTATAQPTADMAQAEIGALEAEGHLVATQASNNSTNNTGQQTAANTANTQSAHTATAQAAASPISGPQTRPTNTPLRTEAADRTVDKIKPATAQTEVLTFAPAKHAAAQPAFKPWADATWSGAWTLERLAGFSDGTGGDLISGGLAGLKGDGGSFSAISIMGGKANAAMTSHVARQLNINVTKAVKAGEQEFAMRMDPPELGRVTVKLRFMADGIVKAHVMAERPETMDMLQREVRGLERAIEAGGGKSADEGISFSLDSGNQESAGKAFAEALQQEKLQEQSASEAVNNTAEDGDPLVDDLTTELNLEDILAHMTPETGIDVRV